MLPVPAAAEMAWVPWAHPGTLAPPVHCLQSLHSHPGSGGPHHHSHPLSSRARQLDLVQSNWTHSWRRVWFLEQPCCWIKILHLHLEPGIHLFIPRRLEQSFPRFDSNLLWYSVTYPKTHGFSHTWMQSWNHHSSLADGLNLRCVSLSSHREFPISHFLLLMLLAYWEGLRVRIAALPFSALNQHAVCGTFQI